MVTEKANSETEYNNGCLGLQGGELKSWPIGIEFMFFNEMVKRVNFMFFHHFFNSS